MLLVIKKYCIKKVAL